MPSGASWDILERSAVLLCLSSEISTLRKEIKYSPEYLDLLNLCEICAQYFITSMLCWTVMHTCM